jgi:beta-lactamase class D
MKNFILLVLSFISVSVSLSACAYNNKNIQDTKTTPDTKNSGDIKTVKDSVNTQGFKKYFDEYGVQGSFMMYDMKNNKYTYYDSARCYVRYSPASTFKIPNSLIGLETGVIRDENYVIPWDSTKRREPCDKDLTLTEAVKISCIYYFQVLARAVGAEKMQDFLNKFDYGNKSISGGIDKFWLDGSITISQAEQIIFLKKFYNGELPVSKRSMDIVRNIIILDEKPGYILRGKTGWNQSDTMDNGWLVGWVETNGNVYIYATNVESPLGNSQFGESRRAITEKILKEMGILK